MSHELTIGGIVRQRADDTTRTVTTYDETGAVTSTRPYTADENAAADAVARARADAAAARIRAELADAILDATEALMADAHTDGQPWVLPPCCDRMIRTFGHSDAPPA